MSYTPKTTAADRAFARRLGDMRAWRQLHTDILDDLDNCEAEVALLTEALAFIRRYDLEDMVPSALQHARKTLGVKPPPHKGWFLTKHHEGRVCVWYSDGDLCAKVRGNLALGITAEEVADALIEAMEGKP